MKLNIKDVLYWMDAIRGSNNKYKTLESFWKGQISSKVWLIEQLNDIIKPVNANVLVCGGWYGVMATLLFNSNIKVNNVRSIDIDPECKPIALNMNKHYEINGKFKAETCNMLDFKNYKDYDIIINTVCEHMSWDQYYKWLENIPKDKLIILQSNNFIEHNEHISCVFSVEAFKEKCGLTNILYSGKLELPKYERYMVIGKKNGV